MLNFFLWLLLFFFKTIYIFSYPDIIFFNLYSMVYDYSMKYCPNYWRSHFYSLPTVPCLLALVIRQEIKIENFMK